MPIKIDHQLPAVDILKSENIFVMDDERANSQQIRPLDILIVNLMPLKEVTETQLLRHLSNTPLQLNIEFLRMASHQSKNTNQKHLETFYHTFDKIKERRFDGMIITGAPVENMVFEEVDYWPELETLIRWSVDHVFSTLHICWGAQAALYIKYGIQKHKLKTKLSGIYSQSIEAINHPLLRGFDDQFLAPHSRYTQNLRDDIEQISDLQILASGKKVGLSLLANQNGSEIYSFGHLEYDRDTLFQEYKRDLKAGKEPMLPENYFEQDDWHNRPKMKWNLAASQFFANWVNLVYQGTPYDWLQ